MGLNFDAALLFREEEMAGDGEVILDAAGVGESREEMADELGITRGALEKRLAGMRETFAERVEE